MNRIVTELIDMTHPDSPAPGCELLPLCDAREHAPQLAAWHAAEWAHLYEGWDAAVALRDLLSEPADGSLPMTLIARDITVTSKPPATPLPKNVKPCPAK